MNPIQKIDNNEAWNRYVRIKALKQHAEEMMLVIGAELYEFQIHKQYEPLGYDTFEAFLADPDIDIARRTAYRMIRVYKTYVLGLACDTGMLTAAGVSKLDMIAPHVTEENKVYLLNMASTLSRSDLHAELTNTEPQYAESWRRTLQEARTLCAQLSKDHNAPLEVREYANDFLSQTAYP